MLIMVNAGMDELINGNYFTPVERKDVAVSKIGVAVKTGHKLPNISTEAALRQTLLDVTSIGHSEGSQRNVCCYCSSEEIRLSRSSCRQEPRHSGPEICWWSDI